MELLSLILKSLFMDLFKSKLQLELEITALRQQLAVYQRKGIRPHLHQNDRMFWVQLSKRWDRWKEVLYIVKPETVLRWHRRRIRKMIASNHKNIYPGAPRIPENVVQIIEKLASENRLWVFCPWPVNGRLSS